METHGIKDVEVFAVGTWNNDIYTESDLDNMVVAFNETKDQIKPFLKLGHDEEQELLETEGLPAAGWIENLRRVGDKLVADFAKVPKIVYELIKAGAYRTISSEIYWNFGLNGKKYPYLLKAVAVLGADIPAVSTLRDIMSLYATGDPAMAYSADGVELRKYEVKFTEGNEMEKELKELKEKLANAEKLYAEERTKGVAYATEKDGMTKSAGEMKIKCAEMTAKCDEMKMKCDDWEKKYSEATESMRTIEIRGKIDELISAKKVLPAQRELLFALLKNMPKEAKYSVDNKEENLGALVLRFAESYQPVNLLTSATANGKLPEKKEFNSEEDAKHDAIKKYMADNKTSYTEAYKAITLEARLKAAERKAE